MNLTGPPKYTDIAILLLRFGVGIVFIIAGWGKLTDIDRIIGNFGNIGIPAPMIMAWVVAIVEFVGGIMVLLGAYTRISAVLLAVVMLVALLTTKLDGSFAAARLDLMLLLVTLSLYLLGSGKYSVDNQISRKTRS